MVARRRLALLSLVVALLPPASALAGDEDPFEVLTFDDPGRTVLAELVDLDGDGRRDLLQGIVRGIPPDERRILRVRLQGPDGRLPKEPTFDLPMPAGAAAYDLGDLRDTPGSELLILRAHDLLVLSLASRTAPTWVLPIEHATTVGAARDERGLERLPMVFHEFGPEPRMLVPLFGEMLVLAPDGRTVASLEVPARANFYVPPHPGFYFGESDIQLFFDAPRLSVGDIDGDGRADIAASNRHEIAVFLQTPEGSFPSKPSRTIALGLVSEKDHLRGSGGVTSEARDFDGDGRLDLLISNVAGSFTDAHTTTTAYLNQDGTWDRDKPVGVFHSAGAVAGDLLVDLDGDGRLELVRTEVPMSVLELVEFLITRAADVRLRIHRFVDGRFEPEPEAQLKLDVPVSFDTFRTAGFLPSLNADVNGDGRRDLLLGGDGDRIEVRLGGQDPPFQHETASQRVNTAGELRVADLEGDGLDDLLIFTPQQPGVPLRLLHNRGRLPGTSPGLVPAAGN